MLLLLENRCMLLLLGNWCMLLLLGNWRMLLLLGNRCALLPLGKRSMEVPLPYCNCCKLVLPPSAIEVENGLTTKLLPRVEKGPVLWLLFFGIRKSIIVKTPITATAIVSTQTKLHELKMRPNNESANRKLGLTISFRKNLTIFSKNMIKINTIIVKLSKISKTRVLRTFRVFLAIMVGSEVISPG